MTSTGGSSWGSSGHHEWDQLFGRRTFLGLVRISRLGGVFQLGATCCGCAFGGCDFGNDRGSGTAFDFWG